MADAAAAVTTASSRCLPHNFKVISSTRGGDIQLDNHMKHEQVEAFSCIEFKNAQVESANDLAEAWPHAYDREQRQTRRRLSALSLWRSHSEMQLVAQNTPTTSDQMSQADSGRHQQHTHRDGPHQASTSSSEANNNHHQINDHHDHCSSRSMGNDNINQIQPTEIETSNHSATNIALATDQPNVGDAVQESAQPKRLWRSLVIPVVLACIIFLVGLWTRQISLAFANDTLSMMIVLMLIFIVMSAAAFWLSCDQHFKEASEASDQAFEQQAASQCRCHLRRGGADESHQEHRSTANQQEVDKCCNISIIDCQPPDYYSACVHSLPVGLYDPSDGLDQEKSVETTNNELYLCPTGSPPSYDQLSTSKFALGGFPNDAR